ncbi:MAG: 50S ribosomal protein L20, partial [Deltaproteobacteria bacterium]|nr:50S ribosomal protein L20 [Deltaproteobacteria bacterium]
MARIKRAALSRVRKNRLYKRVKGFFIGRQRLR